MKITIPKKTDPKKSPHTGAFKTDTGSKIFPAHSNEKSMKPGEFAGPKAPKYMPMATTP